MAANRSLTVECKAPLIVQGAVNGVMLPGADLTTLFPSPSSVTDAVVAHFAATLNDVFGRWTSDQWAEALRSVFGWADGTYVDVQAFLCQASVTAMARDLATSLSAATHLIDANASPFTLPNVPTTITFRTLLFPQGFELRLGLLLRPLELRLTMPAKVTLILPHDLGAAPLVDAADAHLAPFRDLAARLEQQFPQLDDDQVTWLRQEDFDHGAIYLTRPGTYRLASDIRFFPTSMRPSETRRPCETGPQLSPEDLAAFVARYPSELTPMLRMGLALGFFAAIVVMADDVIVDLNKFEIAMAPEYAVLQRFFAIIELASSPFVPMQGPFDASTSTIFRAPRRVKVHNGILGLSSHHGIHANLPCEVLIEDVTFRGYEVAPIAINGGKNVVIQRVVAEGHRIDVPVAATYSNVRYIRQYVAALPASASLGSLTRDAVLSELDDAIDIGYWGVTTHAAWYREGQVGSVTLPTGHVVTGRQIVEAFRLFALPEGVIDGNAYGILSNSRGVAVGGFPDTLPTDCAMMFYVRDTTLRRVWGFVHETPALRTASGKPSIDPIGAVVQTRIVHRPSGTRLCCDWVEGVEGTDPTILTAYHGNSLANAQLLVIKYKSEASLTAARLDARRATADASCLAWVEASLSGAGPAPFDAKYFMNCDVMFHIQKGVIALKLDATLGVGVENVVVEDVRNLGDIGGDLEGDYTNPSAANAASATLPLEGYQGADARGLSLTSSVNVAVRNARFDGIVSRSGDAIGCDVLKRSRNIRLEHIDFGTLSASSERKVEEYDCLWAPRTNNPTTIPRAMALHVDGSVRGVRVEDCVCSGSIVALGARETVALDSGMGGAVGAMASVTVF